MNKRSSGLSENDVEFVLSWLCVEWGFCDARYLPRETFKQLSAEDFATEVLRAEGMETDPDISEWHKKIADRIRHQENLKNA